MSLAGTLYFGFCGGPRLPGRACRVAALSCRCNPAFWQAFHAGTASPARDPPHHALLQYRLKTSQQVVMTSLRHVEARCSSVVHHRIVGRYLIFRFRVPRRTRRPTIEPFCTTSLTWCVARSNGMAPIRLTWAACPFSAGIFHPSGLWLRRKRISGERKKGRARFLIIANLSRPVDRSPNLANAKQVSCRTRVESVA